MAVIVSVEIPDGKKFRCRAGPARATLRRMTSHSPGPVADLFSADGRLKAIPRKAPRRAQLLAHLAETLFEPARSYSEREVNEALLTVHEDFPALRRYLVTDGWLSRTKDGASYRRQQQPGSSGGAIPSVA